MRDTSYRDVDKVWRSRNGVRCRRTITCLFRVSGTSGLTTGTLKIGDRFAEGVNTM
jgi:hypothetical protein